MMEFFAHGTWRARLKMKPKQTACKKNKSIWVVLLKTSFDGKTVNGAHEEENQQTLLVT